MIRPQNLQNWTAADNFFWHFIFPKNWFLKFCKKSCHFLNWANLLLKKLSKGTSKCDEITIFSYVILLGKIGVVVITTTQLHSTKLELRFCACSNPAHSVLDICNGENLWQLSQLDIRLNTSHQSTIAQKRFIIRFFKTKFFMTWELPYFQLELTCTTDGCDNASK